MTQRESMPMAQTALVPTSTLESATMVQPALVPKAWTELVPKAWPGPVPNVCWNFEMMPCRNPATLPQLQLLPPAQHELAPSVAPLQPVPRRLSPAGPVWDRWRLRAATASVSCSFWSQIV